MKARARRRLLLVMLGLLAASPACSGTDTAVWKEEVKLHDGKMIVLERKATIGSSGWPVQHRGARVSWEICYRPMNVYWKSGGAFQPEIFDVVDGVPYVMVPVTGCSTCQLYDYPEPSGMFFKYQNGTWKRIAFSDFPKELDTNLLRRVLSGRTHENDVKGFINLDAKTKRDGDPKWVGGTFRKWMNGERGTVCGQCKARGEGVELMGGKVPNSWKLPLSDGSGCD